MKAEWVRRFDTVTAVGLEMWVLPRGAYVAPAGL